mgnify:CR=1 FL=1
MNSKKIFMFAWPLLLSIVTMILYNIVIMETPGDVVLYASLVITYSVSAICSFILFFATSKQKNFLKELKKTNWASWLYGFALVCTEAGYLYVYRAGWPISTGGLVCNISMACLLIIVGCLFYKEKISRRQFVGLAVCLAGMLFINL